MLSYLVIGVFSAVPGHEIKLKPEMDIHAVKIFAWIIKFCIFVLLPFKHSVKALGKRL